jgi:hypothetical protein
MGHVTFHLPAAVLRDPGTQMKPFYAKLIAGLPARGIAAQTVARDWLTLPAHVDATPGFHIVDHGDMRHPRVLNTGIAYVYPFWHCDPRGIRALSSIGDMAFDAHESAEATAFAAHLQRRLVGQRASRGVQPQAFTDIPRGCIAVFLQSDAHRGLNEACHLTTRAMIAAVVARDDPRPIIIKPHPAEADTRLLRHLARLQARDARVQIVQANIHDILSRAAVTVTINSATGIEAMLHACPVVLCGRADFHHCAVTVMGAGQMDAAIAQAMTQNWPFVPYLYWYFIRHCLNAGCETLLDDFTARIRATGFAL